MKIKVYIIDDHKILVDTFIQYFSTIEEIQVVGFSLSGTDAINAISSMGKEDVPDIVLQDIDLKDMNGIECAEVLLKIHPELKVIGVSSYTETAIVKKLMSVGAVGYISKATDIEKLEDAILTVYQGKNYIGSLITESFIEELSNVNQKTKKIIPSLTTREKEVLELIAQEMNTKEIGDSLFISVNTVQTHRKNLLLKFDVKNSVGLVKNAMELGII